MEVVKTKHYTDFKSSDNYGDFIVRVQNDCSQLTIKCDNGEAFIDINKKELRAIRDMFNQALGE